MGFNNKEGYTLENSLEKLIKYRIIDTLTGCWLWQGAKNKQGYGSVRFKKSKFNIITIGVHRLYYCLLNNYPLNGPLFVLHKLECLNKNCFNPQHLYLGTRTQNKRDSMKLGTAYLNIKERDALGKFRSK